MMADTLPNTPVPTNDWIDAYDASGIPVGTSVRVQNIGAVEIMYVVSATKPTDESAFNLSGSSTRSIDRWILVNEGESGLWLKANVNQGLVNIGRA